MTEKFLSSQDADTEAISATKIREASLPDTYYVIWLTGLPCSGKTTIAQALAKRIACEILDGDDLRGSAFAATVGFTPQDRQRHIERVGYMAKRLSKYSHVVCAFVSPSEIVRNTLPVDIMVWVKCLAC